MKIQNPTLPLILLLLLFPGMRMDSSVSDPVLKLLMSIFIGLGVIICGVMMLRQHLRENSDKEPS